MMQDSAAHLRAFSTLLAQDDEIGKLSSRDLQVLALLVNDKVPLSISAVSTKLEMSPPYASRVADKLVQRGLITRVEGPTDRRITLLEPTEAGVALDERVQGHYKKAATYGKRTPRK